MRNYILLSAILVLFVSACNQTDKETLTKDLQPETRKLTSQEIKNLPPMMRAKFEEMEFIVSTEINRFMLEREKYTWQDVENYYQNELPKYANHKHYKALKDRALVILLKYYNLPLIETPEVVAKTANYLDIIMDLDLDGAKEIEMVYNCLERLSKEKYWSPEKIKNIGEKTLKHLPTKRQMNNALYEKRKVDSEKSENENERKLAKTLMKKNIETINDLKIVEEKLVALIE